MKELQEEQLKQTLFQILVDFNQQGMTLGTEFYVLKDVFNEFTKTYNNFIQQQMEKQKELEKSNEEITNEEEISLEGEVEE